MSGKNNIHKYKLRLVSWVMLILFTAAMLLLLRWQVFDNEAYLAIANDRYRDIKIPSVRGSIIARDGSTLAYSEPRFDFFVWLPNLEIAEKSGTQTREEFIRKVAEVLGMKQEEIKAILESGNNWLTIAKAIDVETRDKLLKLTTDRDDKTYLQSMDLPYVNKRIYPEASLAGQVIGFQGLGPNGDPRGVGGLEQNFDWSLRPQEGYESGEFDSFGNPIIIDDARPLESKPGINIYTTIDKKLQAILEQQLREGFEKYEAKSISGIIMDPKTGAIMAMTNFPNFDPNEYSKVTDPESFSNKNITIPYEIGSVAKVFTLAASLDLGRLDPVQTLLPNGHKGCEIISPNPPRGSSCFDTKKQSDVKTKVDCICTYDRKPTSSKMTVAEALINSDNIGFRHIALTMNYEEFHDYLVKFGIGAKTNIELSGESPGNLKDASKWNYADQAVFSYGHGYEVTPIQAITAIAAIVNEGKRMQPYVVEKIENPDGSVREFKPAILADVVKPATAELVIDVMHEVFKKNIPEQKYRDLKKYRIGLKSGTALIPYRDRAGYSSDINATYVGFDASPEKKFVMLIKIEQPGVGDLSFFNARSLWLDTFIAIKDYLAVPEYSK